MKCLLNIYAEDLIPGKLITFARNYGFDGIRRDILWYTSITTLDSIVNQALRNRDLTWIYLIGGLHEGSPLSPSPKVFAENARGVAAAVARAGSPSNIIFDLGVEATIVKYYKTNQPLYAESINLAAQAIHELIPSATVICETTESTTVERLEWVSQFVPLLNSNIAVSMHTYRPSDKPCAGFGTIDEMFKAIKEIIGGRVWWNTETGWHGALIKQGLCKTWWLSWLVDLLKIKCAWRYTEAEIASFVTKEISYHEQYGAAGFVVYQAFTGSTDTSEAQFGLLEYITREPKLRAELIKAFLLERK